MRRDSDSPSPAPVPRSGRAGRSGPARRGRPPGRRPRPGPRGPRHRVVDAHPHAGRREVGRVGHHRRERTDGQRTRDRPGPGAADLGADHETGVRGGEVELVEDVGDHVGDGAPVAVRGRRPAPGQVDQARDGGRHPPAPRQDLLDVLAGLGVQRRVQQHQLGVALDRGERGAQLVGELGGQPLLGPDGHRHLVQEPVEGLAEGRDLVARTTEVEAPTQVVLAPGVRRARHLGHRGEDPPAGEGHQTRRGEHEQDAGPHGDPEGHLRGALVGRQALAHHDGAAHPLVGPEPEGVHAGLVTDGQRAAGPDGAQGGVPVGERVGDRSRDDAAAGVVHRHVGVETGLRHHHAATRRGLDHAGDDRLGAVVEHPHQGRVRGARQQELHQDAQHHDGDGAGGGRQPGQLGTQGASPRGGSGPHARRGGHASR